MMHLLPNYPFKDQTSRVWNLALLCGAVHVETEPNADTFRESVLLWL